MTAAVLDASAVLALFKPEPGAKQVAQVLPDAVMSAVNYAEVVTYFIHAGRSLEQVAAIMRQIKLTIVPADAEMAELAGHLRAQTALAGLSLGDRFCLALAKLKGAPAWTADRQWQDVSAAVGVEIIMIR
jgi:PIN domain nuclease of toxin-antitoxin system